MEIFKLFGSIFVNTDAADKSMKKTESNAESIAIKLGNGIKTAAKWGAAISTGAVVAGTAVFSLSSKVASAGDAIDKMSQKIGISREAYQELDFVCSQSGTSVDTLQMGIKTLTNQMQSAQSGTKSAVEVFNTLGLSIYDTNGNLKDQETMMWEAMSALQSMENQTEKAALANDLFGRSGSELMPLLNGASGSIEEMRQKAHELGLVMSDEFVDNSVEFTDTIDQVKRSLSAAGMTVAGEFLPHIQDLGAKLIEYIPTIQEFASNISEKIGGAFETAKDIAGEVIEFWNQKLFPAISDVGNAFGAVWDALQPVIQSFTDLLPKMDSNKSAMDLVKEAADGIIEALEWLSEKLQAVATWISEHQTEVEIMATIIGSVAAAILLVNAAITAWNVVAGIATGVTTALGAAMAFLTSPIGLVIVIITALIAIGVALYKNWDTIKEKCSDFVKSVKEKFIELKEKVVEVFGKLKDKVHEIFVDGIWGSIKSAVNWILGGIESMCNGVIRAVNVILGGLDKVVSGVGDLIGLDWNVPMLSEVTLPRLEKGGVLEKGQVGFLEGNGAEAVVPLENNKKWISKVSEEMQVQGIGGSDESIALLTKIVSLLEAIVDNMPEDIREAIEKGLKLNINNREFARLVKAVN